MKKRTLSAVLILAVLISCMIVGSYLFEILMLAVSILCFNELFNIKFGKNKELNLIYILGMICLIFMTLGDSFYKFNKDIIIILPLIALSMPIVFYNNNDTYNINDCFYVVGAVYFLGLAFQNIIVFRNVDFIRCIYIFIMAFITDTYAYIGGNLIGRHKLSSISPKKTIEGSVIGILMGTLAGGVYYFNMIDGVTLFRAIMLSLTLSLLTEIGDLLFSSIKRYFDKKDYSNLIPGHGGMLDRFDSVIYVSLGLSLILGLL